MIKSRLLITGGSGFLGGHLIRAALPYFEVFASYHHNHPNFQNITWLNLNLASKNDIESIIHSVRPDVIIHNAALTNVDYCETHQQEAETVNIHGSRWLSQVSREVGARIVYISTDLVFDGSHPPYSESDSPFPISFYGWTKWQAEIEVARGNPEHLIIRPSIIYGPPAIDGTSFSEWMRKSWKAGQSTPLFTDQFRTPIFAGNLAEAVLEAVQSQISGILHIGGSERISRYDFGLLLAKTLNLNKELIHPAKMVDVALTGRRPADVSLNSEKARRMLSVPLLNCKEGITLAYGDNSG